jgi:phosphoserine aminotransferase
MAGRPLFNFSAGPAMLPGKVLSQIRDELLDWQGLGRSVMEVSHRSAEFKGLLAEAEADLRALMNIPEHYKVLFVHGSASHQFAMVPMNLRVRGQADYLDTGIWSHKAIQEAERFVAVGQIGGLVRDEEGKTGVLAPDAWKVNPEADYLYYTPNETIGGIEIRQPPNVRQLYGTEVPLVADMSSDILSRPMDVEAFGLIFAGAQKNIGTAGLTLVIIREDLLRETPMHVPTLMSYKTYADHGSLYNTPAVFPIYVAAKVFRWIREEGGLEAFRERNERQASRLYQAIDDSEMFENNVQPEYRSWMNIPFTLRVDGMDDLFLKEAEQAGLVALKGHRSAGGFRASLYNAMPDEGVEALIAFMKAFEQRHFHQ